MSTAPNNTSKQQFRMPAFGYFGLIYFVLVLLGLAALAQWGPHEYNGITVLWMLAGFFLPYMLIGSAWIIIDVVRSERTNSRQLKAAQAQSDIYLSTLRRMAHVTEVHDQDGVTAFIVNDNPRQRFSVRIKDNKLAVSYNCAEAKSAALGAATQASAVAPDTPVELEFEDLTPSAQTG